MDWFHCNKCLKRSGTKFAVSSCGHIFCDTCIKPKQCSMCGASCSYLAITDRMKAEEKVFFQDPVKLLQSRLKQIAQIATFQQSQMVRVIGHFKHKSAELEKCLKQVTEQNNRRISEVERENLDLKKQLSELKKELAELRKPLSQRNVSPGLFATNSSQRMSLPVAVTSPVSTRATTPSHIGSAEVRRWSRDGGPSLSLSTPGSLVSISSSIRDYRTPTMLSTPTRTHTPNVFQFMSGLSIQSPRQ